VISCFCHSVNEMLALLGYFTACSGSWLPMFWDSLLVLYARVQRQRLNLWYGCVPPTLLTNKMFKAFVSLKKVMAIIFQDTLYLILGYIMAGSATVTAVPLRQCYSDCSASQAMLQWLQCLSGCYSDCSASQAMLQCCKEALQCQSHSLLIWHVLMLHSNARICTVFTNLALLDTWRW
jgi:hypothetical protein